MDSMNVLIPKEKDVMIQGGRFVIRKMGYRQFVKVIRFASGLEEATRVQITENIKEGTSDYFAIFDALLESKIPELIGILLNVEDKTDVFRNMTVEEISELVLALTEVNDFNKVLQNFQKATGNVNFLNTILKPPSPPPSQK